MGEEGEDVAFAGGEAFDVAWAAAEWSMAEPAATRWLARRTSTGADQQSVLLLSRRDASGVGVGCEDRGIAELKVVLRQPLRPRALTDVLTDEPVLYTDA